MRKSASSRSATIRRRPLWPAVVAFLVTLAGFVAADVVTSIHLHRMTPALHDVSQNAVPSVVHLGRVLSSVVAVAKDGYTALDEGHPLPGLDADVAALDDAENAYREAPSYPGEAELRAEAHRALDAVRTHVAALNEALARGDLDAAHTAYHSGVVSGAAHAAEQLSALVSLNARAGAESAHSAALKGERARDLAYALDFANVLLAVTLATITLRASVRHQRAAESRMRELDAFAGRVAHDLRGPLSPAMFALEWLEKYEALPPPLRTAVARGKRGLGRTTSLVEALLDFARAGALPDTDAIADVREGLAAVVEENEEVARSAGVHLSMAAADPLPSVACTPGVLESIASNLVRNAIHHMGSSPERRVDVRAAKRGRIVRIEVSDTGPGVPAGMESAVFEPYVRASQAEGSGLGLATVKRLVDAHGGSVGVASSAAGATFWFELPVGRGAMASTAT